MTAESEQLLWNTGSIIGDKQQDINVLVSSEACQVRRLLTNMFASLFTIQWRPASIAVPLNGQILVTQFYTFCQQHTDWIMKVPTLHESVINQRKLLIVIGFTVSVLARTGAITYSPTRFPYRICCWIWHTSAVSPSVIKHTHPRTFFFYNVMMFLQEQNLFFLLVLNRRVHMNHSCPLNYVDTFSINCELDPNHLQLTRAHAVVLRLTH